MKLLVLNNSLANFDLQDLKLIYIDPYSNTMGEENNYVKSLVFLFDAIILLNMLLQTGFLMYAKTTYDCNKMSLFDTVFCYIETINLIKGHFFQKIVVCHAEQFTVFFQKFKYQKK